MTFQAKLHIQGVGCYKPLDQPKRLLVVFPDGTPNETTPDGICMHLAFVQFRAHHLAESFRGLGGFVTRFLDRELLTLDTGNGNGQDLQIDLCHLPTMEEALPEPSQADLRPIDSSLLDPQAADSRVMGKLLIEAGEVKKHDNPRYSGKWYFYNKKDAKEWSSVTTVTYSDIDRFVLRFHPLGGGQPVELPPLVPDTHGRLEVWVRNMCDGFPPEEIEKYDVLSESEKDLDFVLNYKVRGNSGPRVVGPVPTRLPEIGTETRKCMGSV